MTSGEYLSSITTYKCAGYIVKAMSILAQTSADKETLINIANSLIATGEELEELIKDGGAT